MSLINLAFIGGTGFREAFNNDDRFLVSHEPLVKTPYGETVQYFTVKDHQSGHIFVFIERHHSSGEFRMPHQLNHPAYMWALYRLGVGAVVATTAVGGINISGNRKISEGSILLPSDFVDLTGGSYTLARPGYTHTQAFHRSLAPSFCPHLRKKMRGEKIQYGTTLGCVITGPRYESPAELSLCKTIHIPPKKMRIPLVGMNTVTGEIPLAIEAGMHYAPICVVTDMPLEKAVVDPGEVEDVVKQSREPIIEALIKALDAWKTHYQWPCQCAKEPSVFDLVPGLDSGPDDDREKK